MKYISSEGLVKLKEELKERKTTRRQEIARRLEEAKSLGDLSENTEYHSTKEAQSFNEGKILELDELISKSVLIEEKKEGPSKEVQFGSAVEVKTLDQKLPSQKRVFHIVGSQEANPIEGKISNESPLGLAFFGKGVDDIIEVETPKGKVKYKIISIK